jgi:uncharacterized protein
MLELQPLDSLRVTSELFAIPQADRYIIYAPLKGTALYANRALALKLARMKSHSVAATTLDDGLLRDLLKWGLLEAKDQPSFPLPPVAAETYEPTDLVILTTSFCNFRCRYCYASAGERPVQFVQKPFDPRMAHAAIRLVVENALAQGKEECNLSFHGGGEPTTAFSFIKDCVEFARSLGGDRLRILPSIVTNGYLSPRQAEWFAANMHSIQVSLDGPPDIQNDQRPLASGRGSFDRVVKTIHFFEDQSVPYLILKATISSRHVRRMAEITQFFCENFRLKRFHLGPVMDAGRSVHTGYREPDVENFLAGIEEARAVAASYGRSIVVSLALETFPRVRYSFCGLTAPNFAVTMEGRVTGCYEVIYKDDERSPLFHYGEYDSASDRFILQAEKVRQLQSRDITHLPKCQNCFARWQCGGDCQARWYDETTGQELQKWPDFRCQVNRELIKRELVRALLGSKSTPVRLKADLDGDTVCI